MRSYLFVLVAYMLLLLTPAHAHDDASWILKGQHKNAAGEWCCGEGDCFVIPADFVKSTAGGRIITTLDALGYPQNEFVPEAETQPSPDGQHWRCQRPDRTRRCFFAPPPNS